MKNTEIINEIDQLIENYCEGCFVKAELRKEKGKTKAHQFCIKECTVGEEIREAGNKLFGK